MREEDSFALLSPHASLLFAVSGGPDSVALMLMAARWRERDAHDIAIATVDHGLRKQSRAEAKQVGDWARTLGFAHHLLTWTGEKPRTRIQECARDARYALLERCAKRIGASAIVTAHHADDQAETILFRLTRGSGVAGLAGMASTAQFGGVALLRPLLDWRKQELIAICGDATHPFIEDPSNANEDFARARLRKLRPILAAQGLGDDALLRLGERAERANAALEHYAARVRKRALVEADKKHSRFQTEALRDLPLEILQRLLAREIARLAPAQTIRFERLERAARRLSDTLRHGGRLRITIAELLLDAREADVTLRPAPPRRHKLNQRTKQRT